jgi:hypothetical protein
MGGVQRIYNLLQDGVTKLAVDAGFDGEPATGVLDGTRSLCWRRRHSWKTETIEIINGVGTPEFFCTNLCVYMPALPGFGREPDDCFDGFTVEYYRIGQGIIGALTCQSTRLVRRVIRDIERKRCWFDYYDTPEDCLNRLERGETNSGLARGTAIVARIDWLRSLIGRKPVE